MSRPVDSWGRLPRPAAQYKTLRAHDRIEINDGDLAHGMGRSYGDSALNIGDDGKGALLQTTARDRIIAFDEMTGILRAQAGITLDAILHVIVPRGWFLPVTPGSKFVTLGGAIANDVHGKNHHRVGSFGNFVRSFSLIRSDGTRLCSPAKNKALFAHTIGGLGLTGVIDWAEIQLTPIRSAYLDVENIPYSSLEAFFDLSNDSADWPYSVAWVDCFAPTKKLGRGIFTRARFSDYGGLIAHNNNAALKWPFATPAFLLNRFTIGAFNTLYRWRPGARYKGRQHYAPFFYPLDGITNWNKLYGRKGFYQHQCLIPAAAADAGMREMLSIIKRAGQGSFLAVLKSHGADDTPGVMSFCNVGAGVSLALDFANKGERTRTLLTALDDCVLRHGGRLYIAKDAHMSAAMFQKTYPEWKKSEARRDPLISSSFWQRTTGQITKTEAGDGNQ